MSDIKVTKDLFHSLKKRYNSKKKIKTKKTNSKNTVKYSLGEEIEKMWRATKGYTEDVLKNYQKEKKEKDDKYWYQPMFQIINDTSTFLERIKKEEMSRSINEYVMNINRLI